MSTSKKLSPEHLALSIDGQPAESGAYAQEEYYLDKEIDRKIRIEALNGIKERNRSLSQNNDERKKYAHKIFVLTVVWSLLIFIILFLAGCKIIVLSDTVIVTLVSSTTVNFFGFFFLVTKYLFNPGPVETVEGIPPG